MRFHTATTILLLVGATATSAQFWSRDAEAEFDTALFEDELYMRDADADADPDAYAEADADANADIRVSTGSLWEGMYGNGKGKSRKTKESMGKKKQYGEDSYGQDVDDDNEDSSESSQEESPLENSDAQALLDHAGSSGPGYEEESDDGADDGEDCDD